MNELHFITGNKGKMEEARSILGPVEQLKVDLPEIQDIDPHEVVRFKLEEAFKHHEGPFIVEDTSLSLDCLGGLPGPFIKWFLGSMGKEGLYDVAKRFENYKARALAVVGYARDKSEVKFFEGVVEGVIVAPRGERVFGWDSIFQPDGHEKTFAEMSIEEKSAISHRRNALNKLKDYLETV